MQPDGKINSAPLGQRSYKRDKTDGRNGLEAKGTSKEKYKSQSGLKKKEIDNTCNRLVAFDVIARIKVIRTQTLYKM